MSLFSFRSNHKNSIHRRELGNWRPWMGHRKPLSTSEVSHIANYTTRLTSSINIMRPDLPTTATSLPKTVINIYLVSLPIWSDIYDLFLAFVSGPLRNNHPKVVQYGHSWMQKMVQDCKNADNCASEDSLAELNAYLKDPTENYVENVVRWWGESHLIIDTSSSDAHFTPTVVFSTTPFVILHCLGLHTITLRSKDLQ